MMIVAGIINSMAGECTFALVVGDKEEARQLTIQARCGIRDEASSHCEPSGESVGNGSRGGSREVEVEREKH